MEENRIRQIKAVVTWTVLWMAVLVLLSMVCVASSGLLPAETVGQWVWFDKASFLLAGCILSALIFKSKGDFISLDSVISWVLVVLGGSEAILGLRQLYGFATSGHSMYALTGSFFNPGPYSGYLAMILPVCLYQWLVCGRRGGRVVAGGVMLLIFCVLPAGMSRSAWLAAGVSCLCVYMLGIWIGRISSDYYGSSKGSVW